MPVLDNTARTELWRRFMAGGHCPGSITKAELRAAVDAADDWVEANAVAYNTALPQPFRGQATPAQKAILLAYVALQRAGEL